MGMVSVSTDSARSYLAELALVPVLTVRAWITLPAPRALPAVLADSATAAVPAEPAALAVLAEAPAATLTAVMP